MNCNVLDELTSCTRSQKVKRSNPTRATRHVVDFFSVALQTLKDLGRLTYRRFLDLFRHMVGLLGRVISPSQGLYLHRTTQHRETRKNIHALSGIRTHDPSNQPAKTHASDRTATVTGRVVGLHSSKTLSKQGIHIPQ
jgi:predicted component of type VI protein secretion system